jgi:hypothetical protein
MTVRAQGEEIHSEPESSRDEEEEEGEITSSPHSPPLEDLPSLGDLFSRQAGISIGARRAKLPRVDTGGFDRPTAVVWPHAGIL